MFTVSSNRQELLASRLDHLLAIAIYTMYPLRYSCNMRLCLCACVPVKKSCGACG